jgi:GGDEF domain-containing protein
MMSCTTAPTVLVVDSDQDNLWHLLQVIGECGMHVIVCSNADCAHEVLSAEAPDLVLLNVADKTVQPHALARRLRRLLRSRGAAEARLLAMAAGGRLPSWYLRATPPGTEFLPLPASRRDILHKIGLLLADTASGEQLEASSASHPLGDLPGLPAMAEAIQSALDQRQERAVLYCDIEDFAAYNRRYGTAAGDRVLRFLAGLCTQESRAADERALLAHAGADDLLLLVDASRAVRVAERIARRFASEIRRFYDPADRKRGWIETTSRRGRIRLSPLLALNLGGVVLDGRVHRDSRQVLAFCRDMCKQRPPEIGDPTLPERRRGQQRIILQQVESGGAWRNQPRLPAGDQGRPATWL